MAVGAQGVIGVASNVIPKGRRHGARLSRRGDIATAQAARKYYPVFKDLFIETNPGADQGCAGDDGSDGRRVRLPLVTMAAGTPTQLTKTLKACGVLK